MVKSKTHLIAAAGVVCTTALVISIWLGAQGRLNSAIVTPLSEAELQSPETTAESEVSPELPALSNPVSFVKVDRVAAEQIDSGIEQNLDITAPVSSSSILYVARHMVVSRFGEFIRSLPLSPREKQEVRRLMIEVQAFNTELTQKLRNGEISESEYREQLLRMETELGRFLSQGVVEQYTIANTQASEQFREQMAGSQNK